MHGQADVLRGLKYHVYDFRSKLLCLILERIGSYIGYSLIRDKYIHCSISLAIIISETTTKIMNQKLYTLLQNYIRGAYNI